MFTYRSWIFPSIKSKVRNCRSSKRVDHWVISKCKLCSMRCSLILQNATWMLLWIHLHIEACAFRVRKAPMAGDCRKSRAGSLQRCGREQMGHYFFSASWIFHDSLFFPSFGLFSVEEFVFLFFSSNGLFPLFCICISILILAIYFCSCLSTRDSQVNFSLHVCCLCTFSWFFKLLRLTFGVLYDLFVMTPCPHLMELATFSWKFDPCF